MCVQALASLAGLTPLCREIADAAFGHFSAKLRAVLAVIQAALQLWDSAGPALVAGLSTTRRAAEQALQPCAAGTMLCHISLELPGTLIVSCKVRQHHPAGVAVL